MPQNITRLHLIEGSDFLILFPSLFYFYLQLVLIVVSEKGITKMQNVINVSGYQNKKC